MTQVQDVGTYLLVTAEITGRSEAKFETDIEMQIVRVRLSSEGELPALGSNVWLEILGSHTCFYKNEELVE